ncbi:Kef-type K+ transport systems (NAD-binding component fused to domain related to exopolyphosphatase) [Minicystis rosea]|nr:Kef-type K+ transport systems (NAD-binding component fused to domain related to exopolyphosphatase) [Minicystis rosea]
MDDRESTTVQRNRHDAQAALAPPPSSSPTPTPRAGKTRVEQLLDAMRAHAGGRHVVVIRGYPDPDSLASAWAHARLAASIGIECDIAHLPLVSRAENRAMVNLLELPLTRILGPEDLDRYKALSLVDTSSIELPRSAGLPCVSIVDHHTVAGRLEADFIDIRTNVGATSTIYTEYLWSSPTRVFETGGITTRLATALAYGIRSDTDDLLRATGADFHALGDLCAHIDADMLGGLLRYAIPASSMRIMRRALEEMEIEGTWAFAGVGEVRPQDRDAIGQAADFLMRRDGIKTVITFGLVEGWIDGSLRTTDPALDPATWLRDAFGIGPLGMPYGGGRRGKGGFQIPLGPLSACPDHRALWHVCKEMIVDTIRRRIGTPLEEDEDNARRREIDA